MPPKYLLPALLATVALVAHAPPARAQATNPYFAIHVVDEATGRGVPLVRLEATDKSRYYTDSNGTVALNEPGLMGEDVWFGVSSYGYAYPHESFGSRGVTLKVTPGGRAEVKLRRVNIAERLYRVTGRGVYRDTLLLGEKAPTDQPALDGKVIGQDSVLTAVYKGKLYWFWGDTNRPSHPLGNFFTSGATSDLPGAGGGLDPAVGVNLRYFTDPKSGFAKAMVDSTGRATGPIWVDGIGTATDDQGRERLFGHYACVKGMKPFERGLVVYDDQVEQFKPLKQLPIDTRLAPAGHPFRANVGGQEYYYFTLPYPAVRVLNQWDHLTDPAAYEAFTCLRDGSRYQRKDPPLDRDADGKLVWKWRRGTEPLSVAAMDALVASNAVKAEDIPFRLRNVDDDKPVRLHFSSVYWNAYRKTWVMIGVQEGGDSYLGEIWFAEANAPEGPWGAAKKIATHARPNDNQDLYNPAQHPHFAQDGGRLIYFEGTYVNTFSGNPLPTPVYDYNQLMYRLDLADSRLKMPELPKGLSDARPSTLGP